MNTMALEPVVPMFDREAETAVAIEAVYSS